MNFLSTFYSVSDALLLEKVLGEKAIPAKMIQVPRALGTSCGYAVESRASSSEELMQIAAAHKIDIDKNYRIIGSGTEPEFIPCS